MSAQLGIAGEIVGAADRRVTRRSAVQRVAGGSCRSGKAGFRAGDRSPNHRRKSTRSHSIFLASGCHGHVTNIPFRAVWASRGKVTRAEPISALYEQGRVHHVGAFPRLEDQMCAFTVDFNRTEMGYSPDRVDALVWGLTELMIEGDGGRRFMIA